MSFVAGLVVGVILTLGVIGLLIARKIKTMFKEMDVRL